MCGLRAMGVVLAWLKIDPHEIIARMGRFNRLDAGSRRVARVFRALKLCDR